MRIYSPRNRKFPANSLFQLFLNFFPLFPLIRGENGVILGRDKIISSPGSHVLHEAQLYDSFRLFGSHFQSFSLYIAVAVAFTASLNY